MQRYMYSAIDKGWQNPALNNVRELQITISRQLRVILYKTIRCSFNDSDLENSSFFPERNRHAPHGYRNRRRPRRLGLSRGHFRVPVGSFLFSPTATERLKEITAVFERRNRQKKRHNSRRGRARGLPPARPLVLPLVVARGREWVRLCPGAAFPSYLGVVRYFFASLFFIFFGFGVVTVIFVFAKSSSLFCLKKCFLFVFQQSPPHLGFLRLL